MTSFINSESYGEITRITSYCPRIKGGQDAKLFLSSDWHWDHPLCDRNMLRRHLDQAMEEGAGICSFGDQLCLMQGDKDPRSSKSKIRPEHNKEDYFGAIIDDFTSFLEPYKDNLAFFSYGNHELSIVKHNNLDLLRLVVDRLREMGSPVQLGPIGGWIYWRLATSHDLDAKDTVTNLKRIAYHHGAGGGGPVTKGTIKTARRAAYRGEADLLLSGHIHENWNMEIIQERVNPNGYIQLEPQHHVQLPTYKQEYTQDNSFHRLREAPPKPIGGVMCHAIYNRAPKNESGNRRHRYHLDFRRMR